MKLALAALALFASAPFAQGAENFNCTGMKGLKLGPTAAALTIKVSGDEANPPLLAEVTGLPGEATLRMNYQDVFGLGSAPDGTVIHAGKTEGDGTIQAVCGGDSFDTLIAVKKTGATYCAQCAN